jgi:pimeloyl-ACP methyl ester carboxylesterase
MRFGTLALSVDPVKAQWSQLHEFNLLSPAQIQNPTLVIAGAMDPYCPQKNQAALFTRIPQTVDKTWVQLAGSDHAAHMLGCRGRWLEAVLAFIRDDGPECDLDEEADSDHPYFTSHGINL